MRAALAHALPRLVAVSTLTLLGASAVLAQGNRPPTTPDEIIQAEQYMLPPEAVRKLVAAPRESNFTYGAPNPGSQRFIMRVVGDGPPSLAAMSRPYYRLAGFEVDREAYRARSMTTRNSVGLEVFDWAAGKTTSIALPAGARVTSATWSPDGSTIAFLALFPNATHIYLADPVTGKSRALTRSPLMMTYVTSYYWTGSGNSIVAVFRPEPATAEPAPLPTATSPRVLLNEQNRLKSRTYRSLFETDHEEVLYEHFITGQVGVIDVKSGKVTRVGKPSMIRTVSPSSDARHFRITSLDKPFSSFIQHSSFSTTEVLIDETGKVLREMAKREMNVGVNPDSNPVRRPGVAAPAATPAATPAAANAAASDTIKRSLAWHPFDTGMLYLASVPGAAPATPDSAAAAAPGNGGRGGTGRGGAGGQGGRGGAGATGRGGQGAAAPQAPARPDRIMHWKAPYDSTSMSVFYESANRITSFSFSADRQVLFLNETTIGTPATTEQVAVYLKENNARFVIQSRAGGAAGAGAAGPGGRGGAGAGPGGRGGAGAGAAASNTPTVSPGTMVTLGGSPLISSDGKSVFFQGTVTDSGKPPRPWVERVEIRTGTKTKLYEAPATTVGIETLTAPLDRDFTKAMIQRESATTPPQSYILDLATGQARQVTNNRDLTPEITNTIKRTYMARRADGYTFKVKVTLPATWTEGTRMPALFWFYPSEYNDQDAYDRAQTTPTPAVAARFPTTGARTMSFITAAGYALVEPDAPIFGSNGMLPNDNYVNDLRNNLAAAIDVLDSAGVIIRSQLALGGHSYGAFSTVNAMVHTPFFKAGIAGDGAYNRTLTPNGFQSEQRDLWQGRSTYLDMSPILYADRLNGALLMYHSTDDQNVGTDVINSTKLFHALQGLGKNTSLYLYPYEDHGPAAVETNLDQWARWIAWLDKYVKGVGEKKAT